jgi:hypothetical protein
LESEDPLVELTPDDKSFDVLKVEMPDGKQGKQMRLGGRTWTINVSYRPDSGFRGPFPDPERPGYAQGDCTIAFKITHAGATKEQPRRIKVMVSGQVRN